MTEPETVRITDVSVTDDGYYRLSLVTDSGVSTIELDRENAIRFVREMLKMALDE